jgi:hypothetical protein
VGESQTTSISGITDANWHHVAVVKVGGNVEFYLDGRLDAEQLYAPSFVFTTPFAIGTIGSDLSASFWGSIDELAIYGRGLTASEILGLSSARPAGKCTDFAPIIFSQPQSQNVAVGSNAVFSVKASSYATLGYQWQLNGNAIPGATNDMLLIPNVQAGAAGTYTAFVSNPYGSATSAPAVLRLSAAPTITRQPRSITALVHSNVTFTVSVSGTAPFGYQWRFGDQPIPGVNSPIFVLNDLQITNAGGYSVQISNSVGVVVSDVAILTVASGTLSISPTGSDVQLNVIGESGASYTIEESSDLIDWSPLVTASNVPSAWQFVDTTTSGIQQRFYRLRKN